MCVLFKKSELYIISVSVISYVSYQKIMNPIFGGFMLFIPTVRNNATHWSRCHRHSLMIKVKGQLMSNYLFGIVNSPKKWKKNTLLLWYLKSNCFRMFFGRIEDTKMTFQNYQANVRLVGNSKSMYGFVNWKVWNAFLFAYLFYNRLVHLLNCGSYKPGSHVWLTNFIGLNECMMSS